MATQTDSKERTLIYPGVSDRIKAATTDGVIILLLIISVSLVFSSFQNVPDEAKMIAFIFIFGLYDPLFTSLFGGTIGHLAMNIRVKRFNDHSKNIIFPLAFIRFVTKYLLGWISLLTMGSNETNSAIHDLVVSSIVLKKPKK